MHDKIYRGPKSVIRTKIKSLDQDQKSQMLFLSGRVFYEAKISEADCIPIGVEFDAPFADQNFDENPSGVAASVAHRSPPRPLWPAHIAHKFCRFSLPLVAKRV